jgi:type 1 glutamine amidotransferase
MSHRVYLHKTYALIFGALALTIVIGHLAAEDLSHQVIAAKILAAEPINESQKSTPHNIVLCWSKLDHSQGTHGYRMFADSFSVKLGGLSNITATAVEGFPKPGQWAQADLVVFFLTQNSLTDSQYALIDSHLKAGKSIIVLHQGLVQRKRTDDWADRIGYAFSWDKNNRSKWGQFENPITLNTHHPILQHFPPVITFKDEFYWNLQKGTLGTITVLGTCRAPVNKEVSDKKWPVLWTVEHGKVGDAKRGRVFCVVIGHFNDMQSNPLYRTLILRGMAWCLSEPFASFAPLAIVD